MSFVDIGALTCAKARVMKSYAALRERFATIAVVSSYDSQRGASANAIERVVVLDHRFHAQKRQQLFVEGQACLEVADRKHHMRHPVDFHHSSSELAQPLVMGFGSHPGLSKP